MNPLAGLLRGSHNGKSHALSERDAYLQIYGERPIRHHSAPPVAEVAVARNAGGRPRDARGRFLPRT